MSRRERENIPTNATVLLCFYGGEVEARTCSFFSLLSILAAPNPSLTPSLYSAVRTTL